MNNTEPSGSCKLKIIYLISGVIFLVSVFIFGALNIINIQTTIGIISAFAFLNIAILASALEIDSKKHKCK
jgi:ABC-type multidrug transport system permease subunit